MVVDERIEILEVCKQGPSGVGDLPPNDHELLVNRDAVDSHPIDAITGLGAVLVSKADASALADYTTLIDFNIHTASGGHMTADQDAAMSAANAPAAGNAIATMNDIVQGGGAVELDQLLDVGDASPTDKNALMADGDSWESRPITTADISGFGSYAPLVHEHAATDITSGVFDMAQIPTDVLDMSNHVEGLVNKHFTADEEVKLQNIEESADVTDAVNVEAAGALMDGEVDENIKTLSLPGGTTITTWAATLLNDAGASQARTTLGAEPADSSIIKTSDVHNSPVNGAVGIPISSQWAFDHSYHPDPHTAYLKKNTAGVRGDLLGATGPGAWDNLAAGANGTILTADAFEPTGLKWVVNPAAGIAFSEFSKTYLDDGNAADFRATVGVDAAGTDNSTAVTLAGLDFLLLQDRKLPLAKLTSTLISRVIYLLLISIAALVHLFQLSGMGTVSGVYQLFQG